MSHTPPPAETGAIARAEPMSALSASVRRPISRLVARAERICRLVALLSGPDGAVLRPSLHPDDPPSIARFQEALPSVADTLTAADILLADRMCQKAQGLCTPRLVPVWNRIADLIASHASWRPLATRIGLGIIVLAFALSAALPLWEHRGFDAWAATVTPAISGEASLSETARLIGQDASAVTAFPAGAYTHAQASLKHLGVANDALEHLWVSDTDPATLKTAFASHPDAKALVAHDALLFASADLAVKQARAELTLAHSIQEYAGKWPNTAVPVALPSELSSAWSQAASNLNDGLRTGDVTSLERADHRLAYLTDAGQQLAGMKLWESTLDDASAKAFQPIVLSLANAITGDDRTGATAVLSHWKALKDARDLSYSLILSADSSVTHGVQRQLAGATNAPTDYLIVKAVDASGAPVTLPVFDTESRVLTTAQTFGVEVSPNVFDLAKQQLANTHTTITVGGKASGDVFPTFSVPVLDGRITHW